jgi:restriction endonuclease Mrr
MAKANVPPYNEMLWPVVQAVAELGGSASIGEIVETAIKREAYSDAQQAVLHNDGPETEIGYRLAWARTYLKGMGLLTNSARGVWALTDDGTALLTDPSATDEATSSPRTDHDSAAVSQGAVLSASELGATRPHRGSGAPEGKHIPILYRDAHEHGRRTQGLGSR